ncbi:unannotated protein [freshwater metagenome]|uniref:Unannotated protein n=1 Tax=freshwater metagenome TaxID=449393 RepID=A0A6J7SKV0_9ZZZZ
MGALGVEPLTALPSATADLEDASPGHFPHQSEISLGHPFWAPLQAASKSLPMLG